MRKILLTVAYEGTRFYGYQKQEGQSLPTVQGELEKALSAFFKRDILCTGASRTDRGVHALGQRVTIEVDHSVPTEKIPLAMRSFLPEDIVIVSAQDVPGSFHPRYDCKMKEYRYQIYNSGIKNPLVRNFSEFCYEKLDIIAMNAGAQHLVGTHDFKAFAASGMTVTSTVRTIYSVAVKPEGQFVAVYVRGDGFLYNMVRIIAGTLIGVGTGKIPPEQVKEILEKGDRSRAGKTAGPAGLTLMNIWY